MERKLLGKKIGYASRGCPLFWKFLKMLFYLLRENAENSSKLTFCLNGKHLIKVSLRKSFFGHYVFSSSYELIFILVGECCICG